MYGKMVKDTRQGWAIFSAMAIIFFVGFATAYWAEAAGNPLVHQLGVAGGNMEGKECRFGVGASALFATVTTDTSCGAVNSMHDSFMPLGGLVPLVNMQLGEIIFGGVGSGLYGMIVFVVLTVFIAGLMVGRTPEYLGKKIERREVQFAILAALVTPVLCLVPTAIAAVIPAGLATLNNAGPHGFSEILYAFTSTNANNGSAFGGLGPNLFYNLTTGVNMMFGRFAVAIPALALAGALAGKKAVPEGPRHVHDPFADLRRAADRRDRHRRCADVPAGGRARADRRTSAPPTRKDVLMIPQRRFERRPKARSLFDRAIIVRAIGDSFKKLDPRWQARNPVMFVVEVGAAVTSFFFVRDAVQHTGTAGFDFAISAWLWFTVLFANFAEAVAEGRGKAQADALRRTKSDTTARLLLDGGKEERVPSASLRKGDRFVVEAGEIIAADGDVLEGAATVDESAITGESAPVIRESGGDRSAVTGGTRVLSDRIVVRVTANPGESFLDRMIALVEGAQRQKTPNEIALSILLSGLTIIFVIAVATLASVLGLCGREAERHRADRAARLSDSDDDRRIALGDRHRRHGSRDAAQRAGDERPRRRSGGRRRYALAR